MKGPREDINAAELTIEEMRYLARRRRLQAWFDKLPQTERQRIGELSFSARLRLYREVIPIEIEIGVGIGGLVALTPVFENQGLLVST